MFDNVGNAEMGSFKNFVCIRWDFSTSPSGRTDCPVERSLDKLANESLRTAEEGAVVRWFLEYMRDEVLEVGNEETANSDNG
jgi:hypothetical protein